MPLKVKSESNNTINLSFSDDVLSFELEKKIYGNK